MPENRLYSSAPNTNHAHPFLHYLYDQDAVQTGARQPVTGNWRPAVPGDFAAEINVSGGLSVSVGNVAVTGGQISVTNTPNVSVTNPVYAVSVTGGYVGVTGTVNTNVTNGILPISGFVTTQGSFALTGSPNVTVANPVHSVSVTGAFPLNVSGNVFINYQSGVSVSNSTASGTNGLAIVANSNRKTWFVQNLATGDNPLFVRMGGPASAQLFHMVLKSTSALYAGDGGTFIDDEPKWRGDVYVSGLNPNYISWDIS